MRIILDGESIEEFKYAIEFANHTCLNQVMEGSYECEYCNP